jgi:hypothetical protein
MMDLLERGWGDVDCIESGRGEGQVESSCECGNEPSGSIKCCEKNRVASHLLASRMVLSCVDVIS